MNAIFEKFHLRYPVTLSSATVGGRPNIPYIKPTDFIKSLSETNDLGRILSGKSSMREAAPLLTTFWSRFEKVFPQHELFGPKGKHLPRERCLPLYIHGDEGTTFKKSAVLLISIQSPLGYGSKRRSIEVALTDFEPDMEKAGIPVNFLKTGFQSRFLCAIAPKESLGKTVVWSVQSVQHVNSKCSIHVGLKGSHPERTGIKTIMSLPGLI